MVRQSVFEHEGSVHITDVYSLVLLVLYLCLKIGSQGNIAAEKFRSDYADIEKQPFCASGPPSCSLGVTLQPTDLR